MIDVRGLTKVIDTGTHRVDILKGKGVLLRVYRYPGTKHGALAYTRWLELR